MVRENGVGGGTVGRFPSVCLSVRPTIRHTLSSGAMFKFALRYASFINFRSDRYVHKANLQQIYNARIGVIWVSRRSYAKLN